MERRWMRRHIPFHGRHSWTRSARPDAKENSLHPTVSIEGSSMRTRVPSNTQSVISLVPSERTLVSPSDESPAFKRQRSVDTLASPSPQEAPKADNPTMPPPTFLMPYSDVPVTSGGREESPSRSALVPQKSGDDDAVVATGSPNNRSPSPSPGDIVPNQEPTDDAVLPSADVHQPPGPDAAGSQGSSSTILPSLEPRNTSTPSTPLSAAALNTEQSSESPTLHRNLKRKVGSRKPRKL
ncbi:hypothetical protein BDZ89DRAFT_731264 [Hymenopellis radicata]|nr:hypothetical protein BDZ89DRAFT_731264 [Hymenopellis radicata]